MITILCAQEDSNYYKIPGLDIWDIKRNAYNYNGNNIVIAHPPCAQWSKLKGLAHDNKLEKELAYFCLEKVKQNGGILEHPKGSTFFKTAGIRSSQLIEIAQWKFGFPAEKKTLLYCNQVNLLPIPDHNFRITRTVESLPRKKRSLMPLQFCEYLVHSCSKT